MYETSGKLKWIGEVQSFASGFTKREFFAAEPEAQNVPTVDLNLS